MLVLAAAGAHEVAATTPPDPGEVGMTITVVLLALGLAVWLLPLLAGHAKKMLG